MKKTRQVQKKVSGTFCAKHLSGRSGKRCLTPFPSISETLRAAIVASGVPLLVLERETGVTRASIRRFLNRQQSLRLDKADALAAYFGLVLNVKGGT